MAHLKLTGRLLRLFRRVEKTLAQPNVQETKTPEPVAENIVVAAPAKTTTKRVPKPAKKPLTRQQIAKDLWNVMTMARAKASRVRAAQSLADLKKKSKVSYEAMHLPKDTSKTVESLIGRTTKD